MQYDKNMCYVKLKYKNVSVKHKCQKSGSHLKLSLVFEILVQCYKIHVFCLGKIVYAYQMFFSLFISASVFLLKINKLQKNKCTCNMIHIWGSVYGWSQLKALWIIWLSNLLIMSVHDEGYSRNALCTLYSISTFWELSLGQHLCLWTVGPRCPAVSVSLLSWLLEIVSNEIINKTKVRLPQVYLTLTDFGYPV